MKYYLDTTTDLPFQEAVERITGLLKEQGFGILSDIDVQQTLRNKLGEDMPAYRILGACNPPFAHKALQTDPNIGTMLPCSVIVRQQEGGGTAVSAIDPLVAMQVTDNEALRDIARQIHDKLQAAISQM